VSPEKTMTHAIHSDRTALHVTLDTIIDTHGLWSVLRALVARPFRRAAQVPPLGLNDHLRRDIGLPPLPPAWDDLR
jgi:hypothetical protein